MFYRVGEKLKVAAKVLCWIGIAVSIWLGYKAACLYDVIAIEMSDEFYLYLILAVLAGCFVSWIVAILLHGFGEMIENSRQQKILLARIYFANYEINGLLDDEIEEAMKNGQDMECDINIDSDNDV